MAKVKLNYAGFRQVRRSCAPLVAEQAELLAARANSMAVEPKARYVAVEPMETKAGVVALVSTGRDSTEAGYTAFDNAKHNTLLKALG